MHVGFGMLGTEMAAHPQQRSGLHAGKDSETGRSPESSANEEASFQSFVENRRTGEAF